MRTTQTISGSLAVVATSALIGLGTPASATTAPAASEPTTTHEKGIVLECHGTIRGRAVYASLYENNTVTNTIQVLIGDDAAQVGGSRDTDRDFLDAGTVRGTLKVGGSRAVVEGTAHRVGKVIAVHEEQDDAGQLITIDGTHRRLANDLELTWKRRTAPLDCDVAFAYNLTVTKVSAVD
jgi:hypothetical protein